MTVHSHDADGLGPPPSPEVAAIRDQFFDDDQPPPKDPQVIHQARESIAKRTPTWSKTRRDS